MQKITVFSSGYRTDQFCHDAFLDALLAVGTLHSLVRVPLRGRLVYVALYAIGVKAVRTI
jgi:hypothetical protein